MTTPTPTPTLDDLLVHFGVKGMHWGVRNDRSGSSSSKRDKLLGEAKTHEVMAKQHATLAKSYQSQSEELHQKGFNSAAAKRVFGDNAATQSDWSFYGQHGTGKIQALQQTDNNLRLIANHHARKANHYTAKAKKLRDKAERIQHTDLDEPLEHFGVKGMHWGVRGSGGGTNHPVSLDAARAHDSKTIIRTHGTDALSNAELQHVVTRMNLERQHGQLNPTSVGTGRKIVTGILHEAGGVGGNIAKQQATNFGNKYAAMGVEELLKRIA